MAGFRALLKEATASGATLTDRETKLLRENYKAREKLRIASEALVKAGEGKVPDGAVVLPKEEAEAYTEFKKLGVPVKDIVTRLAERDTLAADKAKADADKILDAVAEELGLNPRAFKRLVAAEGLTVTVKTVKVKDEDGKTVEEQIPVVRTRGAKADAEPEELSAVLERDFAEDLDTLVASGDAGDRPTRATRSAARETIPDDDAGVTGTRFPRTRTTVPSRQAVSRKQQEEIVTAKASKGGYSL